MRCDPLLLGAFLGIAGALHTAPIVVASASRRAPPTQSHSVSTVRHTPTPPLLAAVARGVDRPWVSALPCRPGRRHARGTAARRRAVSAAVARPDRSLRGGAQPCLASAAPLPSPAEQPVLQGCKSPTTCQLTTCAPSLVPLLCPTLIYCPNPSPLNFPPTPPAPAPDASPALRTDPRGRRCKAALSLAPAGCFSDRAPTPATDAQPILLGPLPACAQQLLHARWSPSCTRSDMLHGALMSCARSFSRTG